ncbi:MAG: anaerobic ribonucleoside-triphosphate reductase activating protein, partial [bacterium]
MLIGGLQKTTLIDYPGKVACIVFTMGCNFRCGFCHNPELIDIKNKSNISEDVFFDFLKKRKKILDGVVVTGGEPLLQKDIKNFIIKIKKENFLVKLDTNGTFPDMLKELIDLKLIDYVAMDLKNVLEKYSDVVNAGGEDSGSIRSLAAVPCEGDCGGASGGASGEFAMRTLEENVLKSIKILLENKIDYEFRTTVVEGLHTKEDLIEISKLIKGAPRYFLQKFVAAPKLLDKTFGTKKSLPAAELEEVCRVARRYV